MISNYIKTIAVIIIFLCYNKTFAIPNISEGKKIFYNKCASCHHIDKKLVGPPIRGITKKYDEAWFVKWVTSSTAMIKAGDAKAIKIFNEYYKTPMADNKDLSVNQIKSIYQYLKKPD